MLSLVAHVLSAFIVYELLAVNRSGLMTSALSRLNLLVFEHTATRSAAETSFVG